jgi:Uma2 family endonuclease
MATKTLMTAKDLLNLKEDGWKYELVRGELVRLSPGKPKHGKTIITMATLINNFVKAHDLGTVYGNDTGFIVAHDPDTVRGPDVAFVAKEHIPPEGEPDEYWDIAPDLVVEVPSDNDTQKDVQEKVTDYLNAGVRLVWVVNPQTRTVEVHSPSGKRILREKDTLTGGRALPGFRCKVADIFK